MRLCLVRVVASVALVLGACTDLPNEPSSSTEPRGLSAARGGGHAATGKTSLDLIEDDYAVGAIDKQRVNVYREQALSAPGQLPAKYRSSVRGKDATASLVRMAQEWSSLSKSTQQEILDLRANGLGNLSQTVETAHFVLHYTTTGQHSVPLQDADRE